MGISVFDEFFALNDVGEERGEGRRGRKELVMSFVFVGPHPPRKVMIRQFFFNVQMKVVRQQNMGLAAKEVTPPWASEGPFIGFFLFLVWGVVGG